MNKENLSINDEVVVKGRRSYPTAPQKARLLSLLEADEELRRGKFSAKFTKKVAYARWNSIGEELNSIPGANKNWKEWRKTWQDMKSKAKTKQAFVRRSANITGGGSPAENLTEQDIMVMSTISDSALVGHTDTEESAAIFNWDVEILEAPPVVATTSYEAPLPISNIVEDARPQEPLTRQAVSQQTDESPQAPPATLRKKKTSAASRLQKSIDTAVAINQTLQIKNDINMMKVEEIKKQTEAMNRQADAINRQAAALEHLIFLKFGKETHEA